MWVLPTRGAWAVGKTDSEDNINTPQTTQDRPKKPESTWLFGVGYTNQYDTYISPLEYHGTQISLLNNYERELKRNDKITFQSTLSIQAHTSALANSSSHSYGGDLHYDAGWYHHWKTTLTPHLSFKTGALAGITLGGLYNNHSGNNPANAHASVRLSASVGARYLMPLRRTRLLLDYQADLPLIGAAFSPDYGQAYYEMYKHGYCSNICTTHPGNAFCIRQLFTIDIALKKSTLVVGYQADLRQAKLNCLRQHQYSHSIMIGWRKGL